MTSFIHSFQSEWLKKKGTLAFWLVIVGGFFIPLIFLVRGIVYSADFLAEAKSPQFWEVLSSRCWQFMAMLLLPLGVALATSLITQIEFRNNTWKQLNTTPQSLSIIYWSKFAVIIVMLLQFFILFHVGMYLSALIPAIINGSTDFYDRSIPFESILKNAGLYFVDCLPIVAIQYLVSLQFKNFLVPLSFGIGLLIASLIAVQWKYGYIVPYTYCPYNMFSAKQPKMVPAGVNFHYWAVGYFVGSVLLGYFLYINKKEKG